MDRDQQPRRTPLFGRHVAAGGRMVDFAGFSLPVQYSSVMEEHRAVRRSAGLFDVSHMGEIEVTGPGAGAFVDELTPNSVSSLEPGRAHYSGLLTERGTYLDDLLVYRRGADLFLLVVNAANREKDWSWIRDRAAGRPAVEVRDRSDDFALLALQGPAAAEILAPLTDLDLPGIRYYRFREADVAGRAAIVSRTGYTGEDGFELYVAPEDAGDLWDALLTRGAAFGLVPAGLGARDTLRLEAGMALYGHELDEETTPWEAGTGWVVKLDKGPFVGRDALVEQKEAGPQRALVGFEVADRGIAREGHRLFRGEEEVGRVTSGTFSPTFEKALGMAFVRAGLAATGTELEAEVRGRRLPVRLVDLPFYRRPK
jgi:aminomethyltransferase